jgi:outer membrane protein assembly factor BamB
MLRLVPLIAVIVAIVLVLRPGGRRAAPPAAVEVRPMPAAQLMAARLQARAGADTPAALGLIHAAAAQRDLSAATLGSYVYLFVPASGASGTVVIRLDPLTRGTRVAGHLPEPRSGVGVATLGGTIYLVGGEAGRGPSRAILAWRPGSPARVAGTLPIPLSDAAVAADGGRLVIAGGVGTRAPSRQIFTFDPARGQVSSLGVLPRPVWQAAAATLGQYVYVIGGHQTAGAFTREVLAISPRDGASGTVGSLPQPVSYPAAIVQGDTILVAGATSGAGAGGRAVELALGARLAPSRMLRAGSDPSVLPGNVLIADKANSRLLIVSPQGRVVWSFPRPGELRAGQSFEVPDDAFFSYDGRQILATQEDDFAISLIDVGSGRIAYRYGHPGVPGSGPGYVYNPDDAIPLRDGTIVAADIKNCRLIELRPALQHLVRQIGTDAYCFHNPPSSFGSPNGAFPLADGGTVVTEINGDWIDVFDASGRLAAVANPPGFTYPSDTNEVRPGVYLSVDYTDPGTILEFDVHGHVLWRFSPAGPDALNHPSLALPLPNGDILANDDYNDRVIVVDPATNRIVWQYGHTGVAGTAPGYLNNPDGVDLAPPYALTDRFPQVRGLPG